jgi:hypothetical protein
MIKRVEAWVTSDGKQHPTEAVATKHELKSWLTKVVPEGAAEQLVQAIENQPDAFATIVSDFVSTRPPQE